MLSVIKKELNISIITSIIYVVLGIAIIVNPETMLSIAGITIAILSIIYGIISIIINVRDIKSESSLVFGIISIVIGIVFLVYPDSLSFLISIGLGIWFIASSTTRIKFAILLKAVPTMNWALVLIGAIITLGIGVSFIFAPLASAVALTTITGVLMLVYSVIDLMEIIVIKMHIKDAEGVIK
ncbi:MAG: DUF308 domain-containing protein [Clostridia bacterium]|nr:DUF308 domain-containing protein [Clostridia bacterium]